ncbi:hypothetical protein V5799_015887 [Amblyomma americanum]|uniref:Peptidase M13 N-terminal domain-containing protein n=1 Tax=Amblyomma americanum TaxID=6943 RepID=A0AAQ4F7Q6_AMBAM
MEDSMMSIMTGTESEHVKKEFNNIKDECGLSGWPYSDTSESSDWNTVWKAAAKMCKLLGINALVKVTIEPDPDEVDKFVVANKGADVLCRAPQLDEPDVFLRKSDVHRDKKVNWYTEAVTTALKEGAKIAGMADASSHASSVVTFVTKLVKSLSLPSKMIMGTTRYRIRMMKDLPMELQKYVSLVVSCTVPPSDLANDTRILLKSPEFILQTVKGLIEGQASYVVINYLGFRLMTELSPYLADSVQQLRDVWYTQFTGMYTPSVDRWRACMHSIDRAVPLYLLYLYSEFLNTKKKSTFKEVVARMTTDKIGRVFTENINRTKWMDSFTKYIAEKKLPTGMGQEAIKQYFMYMQHFREDVFKAYTTQKARMKQ